MQTNLFNSVKTEKEAPLPFRVRPKSLNDYVGQENVVGRIKNFTSLNLPHVIFYGPPGTGKTTLSELVAIQMKLELNKFSAVMSGIPELRKLIERVIETSFDKKQIIFIDEIHRFNKSQQDALLPYLEEGKFILIGATTEIPQISLNRALLSRVKTYELKPLFPENIKTIIENALKQEEKSLPDDVISKLSLSSNGDARFALNVTSELLASPEEKRNLPLLDSLLGKNSRLYDKNADRHYDVVSAFIKSIRGSDPDAALLWLAVMLDGGEDPVFIARRLMISASEDIGLADINAMRVAGDAHYAVKNIGMPEARIILSNAVIYLCLTGKSNSAYNAINSALHFVEENPTIEVPLHLRNNHPMIKEYKNPHHFKNNYIEQNYTDKKIKFYKPSLNEKENKLMEGLFQRKN